MALYLGEDLLRILFFIGSLSGGGAERVVIAIARFFLAKGYSVGVVTLAGYERDFYPLPEGVDRVVLDLHGESSGASKFFNNLSRLIAIRDLIKKNKTDVLVGMMTTPAILSVLAVYGLDTRVIVSERNFPGRKPCSLPWAILRRLVYRFAHAHVAQTREAASWLRKYTGAKNVHVVPNSVKFPLERYEPKVYPSEFLAGNNNVLLSVGTKIHQKGFDLLLYAFSRLSKKYPEWRLVLVGISNESPDGHALRQHCDELGVMDRVIFPGKVGNVGDWYARADLFVLSSRYEGFPNVLLEAMATGCPSIAFDCDTGPRDIIESGINGVLVADGDCQSLEEELDNLMGDDEERRRLSKSGMMVRDRFSEEKVLKTWSAILKEFTIEKSTNVR